ncbi:MAG: hypothetical protein QG580_315 [Patescibacteria group bacterium]|jgi:hypothetical protein|nr:hypothetical protein [Patescibacteria group bacterium]
MANFDKHEVDGKSFIEIGGKLLPHRTLEPHEMFTDGEEGMKRFQKEMEKVREEYTIKAHSSWLKVRDIVLR